MSGRWGTARGQRRTSDPVLVRSRSFAVLGGADAESEAAELGRELRGFFRGGDSRRKKIDKLTRELTEALK